MGKFDSRRSTKKKRRIGQAKKKSREQRQAMTARLTRIPGLAKTRIRVFISYCHHDHPRWVDLFVTMLRAVDGRVVSWVDRQIAPGEPWLEEVNRALATANGSLLLVTPKYMASEFIRSTELPTILGAGERREMRIFWVHVSATPYQGTQLSDLHAAYPPDPPLDSLRPAKRNMAIASICEKILNLAPASLSSPMSRPSSVVRKRKRTSAA